MALSNRMPGGGKEIVHWASITTKPVIGSFRRYMCGTHTYLMKNLHWHRYRYIQRFSLSPPLVASACHARPTHRASLEHLYVGVMPVTLRKMGGSAEHAQQIRLKQELDLMYVRCALRTQHRRQVV